MVVLGIETSCDETSAAVYDGERLLSNVIFSQVDFHRVFGGVVPEIAAREHLNKLPVVVDEALSKAGMGFGQLGGIAVTYGPGLAGPLITGLSYAKALAYALKIPFAGVNHLEAHLLSPFLEFKEMAFPFIGVVVSGGHTNIYFARGIGEYELIAQTRDDAAGEAFDKAAKMMGLPYPGGPSVSAAAKEGDTKKIIFPQAQMKAKGFDFSFSGIKTAVLYYLQRNRKKLEAGEVSINDVAAAFQKAVVRAVVNRLRAILAVREAGIIAVSGGVAANKCLKEELEKLGVEKKIRVFVPSLLLCTDNAGMIAYTGYLYLKKGKSSDMGIEAVPELKI
ncbi:MAG TPA: tRNA (adenosine(37)-N6)-threonylcarbamoyltransferase complex transferase subunit TsaD [bacterium]|nr:tRNA (adenosine(37)-N6)-threonylcarbamoyltransferase complex transferase subunit TsaD [bacterium]